MEMTILMPDFKKRGGFIPVVVQDKNTGEILMLAYVGEDGFLETLKTGEAVFYSTSKNKRWKKGETSGNVQIVHSVRIDCDRNALIYTVTQKGEGACHTGKRSCFYRSVTGSVLQSKKDDSIRIVSVHKNISVS